jgi:tetratricopeptide (TPR) repeat protein
MEIRSTLNRFLSIFFICLATTVFSQDEKKKSVGDVVYEEYQKGDVDKALDKYRDLKAKNSADYNFTEWELNRIGYRLMEEGDLDAAEKVFKLNIEEYPQAANPHDSYADYLMEKGDKKEARKHYEKAVSMAEKSTREDEKDLLRMSKAKLAKLDGKHEQLDFLMGEWEVKSTSFVEGLGGGEYNGRDEYLRNDDENIMMINHLNEHGDVMGKRIMVYDALEDVYDVAYINVNAPMGIETSTLKLKDLGNNTIELSEKSNNKERANKMMKHELKKRTDGGMDWVIYEADAGKENWKKVYAMDMRKNN